MRVHSARELAKVIKRRRIELGLSQIELAKRVGASRHWLMEMERGKPSVSLHLVLETTAALGLMWDIRPAGPLTADAAEAGSAAVVDLNQVLQRALQSSAAPAGKPGRATSGRLRLTEQAQGRGTKPK